MGTDYGEILCTAVDEIISARLQGLQYDITKLCTIVDDTNSYQGKYVVSDGTAKYEAFTTDNNLKKGNSVLVNIPNGDYAMQKTIKGRVAATNTTPFKYTSPLDTMIKISDDVLNVTQPDWVQEKENWGLVANWERDSITRPLLTAGSIEDTDKALKGIAGFTRLGISADFKSLLSGLDVVSGSYGLKVVLYAEVVISPGNSKDSVFVLDFNSSDMIGNPYQFEDYFSQEKVFDISYISSIKRIDVYFYQGNNFLDGSGNKIPYSMNNDYDDGILDSDFSLRPNNLFVDNVKIYLGYDKNEFSGETLMVYTNDLMTYHYKKANNKTIYLRWIHLQDDGEHFDILQDSKVNNNNSGIQDKEFTVKWYKYSPGCEIVDKYAGKDWELIPSSTISPLACEFIPDVEKQTEEIKAVGIIRSNDNINVGEDVQPLETAYVSNLLIFENEENVPDGKTWDASSALSIHCEDSSEGNYFIYNQNGKINNQGLGQGYIRYLKAYFKGAEITSDIGTLDYIRWYIPQTSKIDEGGNKITVDTTMLIYENSFGEANSGIVDKNAKYRNQNYIMIQRNPNKSPNLDGKFEFTSSMQAYSISNQWNYQKSNNTVGCIVSIDGVQYEAIEELRFGKAGTNGTDTTLVIELEDNANALVAEKDSTISVRTWMYNSEGARTGFTPTNSKDIVWSWYKHITDENGNEKYMTFESDNINDVVTIKSLVNEVPKDNFYILQATYRNMTAYLPIPMKTNETGFIEGAREVIYNHQGNPSYYNDAYNLYYYNNNTNIYNKVNDVDWSISYGEEITDKSKATASYYPILKELPSKKKALSAATFYAKGYDNRVCVYGANKNYAWAQPILIMQSNYDFAMLNDWDGKLTLDKDNGTILSTMLGAGRKDNENKFSGVLIGDVQKGTGLNDAQNVTGVYGLNEGVISYQLTDDGKAIFGKKDRGQIIIDGNKSTIQSANYNAINNTGTLIDLDDGFINMMFPDKGQILLSSEKAPYLKVTSPSGSPLINIGYDADNNPQNFIQSDSGTSGSVKIDLSKGSLNIKTEGVMEFLVDSNPTSKDPYLKIGVPNSEEDNQFQNNLLLISENEYYLQSKEFEGKKIPYEYVGKKIRGTLFQYFDKKVFKYNKDQDFGEGRYYLLTEAKEDQRQEFYFANTAIGDGYVISEDNKLIFEKVISNTETVFTIEQVEDYIKSRSKIIYKNTEVKNKGFKLDLKNSSIIGYDLYLSGTNSTSGNSFILDSGAPVYPFLIGKNFKVDWNGNATTYNMVCNNLTVQGNSNIGGNTSIDLGSFHISSNGSGSGYWGGEVAGVAGYGGVPLSSLENALSWTVYVK